MQKIDVLTIEEGMPISIKRRDGETIEMFIHTYEDGYDENGMNDDGTPKRIVGHSYNQSDSETIVWDVDIENSSIQKVEKLGSDGNTVEKIEAVFELEDISTI